MAKTALLLKSSSLCLYSSNFGTFWLKIEQFWPFEEISIFGLGVRPSRKFIKHLICKLLRLYTTAFMNILNYKLSSTNELMIKRGFKHSFIDLL
jgi:hypothetical protein